LGNGIIHRQLAILARKNLQVHQLRQYDQEGQKKNQAYDTAS
jgi:hypothetical protein